MTSLPRAAALNLSGITRRFGAVTALDDADLLVRAGTVHALLGENGAGKTTLMHIAYGMLRADAGEIHVDGRLVHLASPLDAISAGIGMVHQHFTLVPAMTVAENLALGGHGRLRAADISARVRDVVARTGFVIDPAARVETLPVGAQQRVEIAKALSRNARLLILDEPTAVLAPAEVEELLRWLREYVASGNAAVIITHKLLEALAVADDVTVLRHGRVTHAGKAYGASPESLTLAMVGEGATVDERHHPSPSTHAPVVVRAKRVTVVDDVGTPRLREATFELRAGELIGVVGVEGAGHRELLRVIARRVTLAAGTMDGPAVVGFIPEDRHRDAVMLDRPLAENVALRGAGARGGLIDWTAERTRTTALMKAYDVRAPHADVVFRSLSGGNQQKLVVARELEADALPLPSAVRVIVAENPTRGLDVRATAAVHTRLRGACTEGATVVFYSSDLDEVLRLASRVLVVFDGTVRELPVDRETIARAILGLS